jgi:TrmH family RNA methyltransferase
MLTKAETRVVVSLQEKKARDRLGLYVAEGDKLVREALALGSGVETVYAVAEWLRDSSSLLEAFPGAVVEVSADELRRLSAQKTPNGALALIRQPHPLLDWRTLSADLVLVLDAVRDPGNLGSLLRVAAWFGIADVVASLDSADAFQPKVVQASMGALFHVRVHSLDIASFLVEARDRGLPIYGAVLQGDSIYEVDLERRGVVLFGNESSGLSEQLLQFVSHRLVVPAWRESGPGRDSLNVAMAAAVVCSEFRRRASRSDAEEKGTPHPAGVTRRSTMPAREEGV